MKKKAIEIKKDDEIIIAGKKFEVSEVEVSDIGKQGKKKVRLELKDEKGDKLVIIRPEDYPIDLS